MRESPVAATEGVCAPAGSGAGNACADGLSGGSSLRHWSASLDLRFAARDGQTLLVSNRHRGPLRLIKALHADPAEPSAVPVPRRGRLDAIIVHPPGGLVDGDSLQLTIDLDEGACVRSTTPGSQKWYRGRASARTHIRVASGAQLEWLPQPTIVYDGAYVDQSLLIELAGQASTIGSECLVLGRRSMGERFVRGWLRQAIRIHRDGRPIWQERTDAAADSGLWQSPAGWAGRVVCASVWAIGGRDQTWDDAALVEDWRGALEVASTYEASQGRHILAGATRMSSGIVLAKILGDEAGEVAALAQHLWALARPGVLGEPARPVRIWAT